MGFYGISIHAYSLDFSHRVFQGIQAYSYIDLKEDSIKEECYKITSVQYKRPFIGDLIRPYRSVRCPYKQLGLEIRLAVSMLRRGMSLHRSSVPPKQLPSPCKQTPFHIYIYKRDQ
jgi:hypothetical protein